MAIVENGAFVPIGFFYLVQRLSDKECADAISGKEGEGGFKEIQASESRELIQHQQDLMPAPRQSRKFLTQSAGNLVENEPDQGTGSRKV